MKLDVAPNNAFGFQLRNDGNRPARAGMLDLLQDAFNNNWTVGLDYDIAALLGAGIRPGAAGADDLQAAGAGVVTQWNRILLTILHRHNGPA